MIEKLSSADINRTLIKCASVIRGQQQYIQILEAREASRQRQDQAVKIAHVAVEKGIVDAADADEYASQLAQSDRDLKTVEEMMRGSVQGIPLTGHQKLASEDSTFRMGSAEDKFLQALVS